LLIIPFGLAVSVYLTRRLGPGPFGLFALTTAVALWLELLIGATFSTASVRLISARPDWRSVGVTVIRLSGLVGLAAGAALWLGAAPLARLFSEGALSGYFRLAAVDIPLNTVALAYQMVLTGRGRYGVRARLIVLRWAARLVLTVILVEAGLSVPGAVLGFIGGSTVELIGGWLSAGLRTFKGRGLAWRDFWSAGSRYSLAGAGQRLFERMDMAFLKAFGATAAQAGHYGAALNIAVVPALLTSGIVPVLVGTLSPLARIGDEAAVRSLGRLALRAAFWLPPLAALVAGSSLEIVTFLFGPGYRAAAPVLSLLIFAATGLFIFGMGAGVLGGAGQGRWLLRATGLMLAGAVSGYLIFIPLFGSMGAAGATTGATCLGALGALTGLARRLEVRPPRSTVLRSLAVSVLAGTAAGLWPSPGPWVVLKLAVLAMFIALAFTALGEFSRRELLGLKDLAGRLALAAGHSRRT
jgi:O-antigen/teichoic acid export membrane protein